MDDLDVLEKDPTGHAPYLFGLATLAFADGTELLVLLLIGIMVLLIAVIAYHGQYQIYQTSDYTYQSRWHAPLKFI